MRSFRVLAVLLQRTGPYLLLELLLPGGTLFALLLYLYQRRQPTGGAPTFPQVAIVAARVFDKLRLFNPALAPSTLRLAAARARGCERDGLEPLAMAPLRCGCGVHAC